MALRDNILLSCLFLLVFPSPGSCVLAKPVPGYLEEDIGAASTTGLLEAAADLAPLGASSRKEHAVIPMESTRRSPGPSPGAAQQAMALWGSQGSAAGASATKTLSGGGAPSHRLQSPKEIFSCGGCTWIADPSPSSSNVSPCLTLRMVGAPDCGAGCPTILGFPKVISNTWPRCQTGSSDGGIDAGAFKTTGLGHVTQLYLSGNQLNSDIPSLPPGVFDQLTGLKKLYLSGCTIRSLPAGVFDKLTGLTVLDLSGNHLMSYIGLPRGVFDQLTGLRMLILRSNSPLAGVSESADLAPGVFDKLTGLRILDLRDNWLTSLPAGVFDPLTGLTGLFLVGNHLASLPAGVFDQLTGITVLDLSRNAWVNAAGMHTSLSLAPGVFDKLTGLTKLDLSYNGLMNLPAGVFDKLTGLAVLDLSYNGRLNDANPPVSYPLISLSAGVFDKLTGLTKLDLSNNGLISLPAGVFDKLSGLATLDLRNNRLISLPAGLFDNVACGPSHFQSSLHLDPASQFWCFVSICPGSIPGDPTPYDDLPRCGDWS